MNWKHFVSTMLLLWTLDEHSLIYAIGVVAHAILCNFLWSTWFVQFLMHSWEAVIDSCNLYDSSWKGIFSYSLTHILHSSSQYCCFPWVLFTGHARCNRRLLMGFRSSSAIISPYHDWVNVEINSEAIVMQWWRCTCRPSYTSFAIHLEAVVELLRNFISRLWFR
jgi:hypothetical protein